ncbi:MAG: GxxExxY protein [Verrucomicrobiota bacterium]
MATEGTEGAKFMTENDALQLADIIRQTAFESHKFLRHGHGEKIYENSLRNRLRKKGFTVQQQHPLNVYDEDGELLGEFFTDLIVNGEFIIELKAVRHLLDEHTAQVLGYLRASRHEHALLINFGAPVIQLKKLIFRAED